MEQLTEQTEVATTPGQAEKLARLISNIANPLFVALPTFLVVALDSAPDLGHALLWWVVSSLGISLLPFLFIWRGVRAGRYTDHHVSVREQRFVPLLFAISCMILTGVILALLGISRLLVATLIAMIATCGLALLITRFWKISLHLVGVAGATTLFVLLFGPRLLLLVPLVVLVGWARWQVGAHTVLQALAGTVLSVLVGLAVFGIFHLF